MQNPEIHVVGAVGTGRMAIRFDLRGVVAKHVEDVVTFASIDDINRWQRMWHDTAQTGHWFDASS
jgi:hypothetical protein